jgi:transposase InsO family protein
MVRGGDAGKELDYVLLLTLLWTEEGWLYLAVVLELYSRRVIGWAISERMTAALVCDNLIMVLWRCHMPKGVIVRSDRGSQYCSAAYQKPFTQHQLISSTVIFRPALLT